ncbi:aldose epimerase family protein [Cellulomonas rhizosphaerae]|uniref:Aldose epimerase n=1 Tax=Cellulomonas rhizosphaerae TaxID=2293719 RepID=A0A413RJ17_9CELL|nr:aldose epimerase [Cellulomonas rhizosphaerae]RHA38437.1 aldose epimerase [Cellulomonas rhizosphaerae]
MTLLEAPSVVPPPAPATTPADPRVTTLRSSTWELDVAPLSGAALTAGRIRTADGVWRDLLRPTRRSAIGDPEKCASFPMVPWSNRLREGVLSFGGRTWQLQRNGADGTAIHGAVRYSAWSVVEQSESSIDLELETSSLVGVNFPWRFASRIRYEVVDDALRVTTSVRNTDTSSFPAGFGHHPYLQRSLHPAHEQTPICPPGQPVVHIPTGRGYPLDHGMATGAAGAVPARADFSSPRALGSAFIDDVLRDWRDVRVTYPEAGVTLDVRADPIYEHLVVYAPRRRACFAIEPVTNVNGGFALHGAGVPGTGVFVLEPGEERTGSFTFRVSV